MTLFEMKRHRKGTRMKCCGIDILEDVVSPDWTIRVGQSERYLVKHVSLIREVLLMIPQKSLPSLEQ